LIILQHSLPNIEDGALKNREDTKLLGTPKETILLQPSIPFYKKFAVDCSPQQISIDVFLFNGQYCDLATIGRFLS
jgi:protein transport protein SEC24